jgi:superfamily II DNA or RNA helicase
VSVIIVNNNKSQISCSRQLLDEIREHPILAIKAKGYFFCSPEMKRRWDGKVRYVTEAGYFETGLLDQICAVFKKLKAKYEIRDNRQLFKPKYSITELAGMEFRDDQVEALNSIFTNRVMGLRFPRGIMAEATNYGKSLIAAGLFLSYADKRKGLFLINSKALYDQALSDLRNLVGKEDIGQVNSKITDWRRINVCMVQTLGNRIKKDPRIRNELSKQDIIIVDEADEVIGFKVTKAILSNCFNASIRIALTGTELKSKDKNKNQEQLKFFGPVIHKTTNKQLVERGVSVKPIIRFYLGNYQIKDRGNYANEYQKGITKNKVRHRRIWKLVKRFTNKNQGPILILFRYHEHAESLMKACPTKLKDLLRISVVHGKSKNRGTLVDRMNDGKIDVLLSSMIFKRGMNLPLINTLVNAAGGDSHSTILQVFGRGLRKNKTHKHINIVEFFDMGYYLQKHSKHRIKYYSAEGFKVRELYKKKITKKAIKLQ